jgi:hypothetical protein
MTTGCSNAEGKVKMEHITHLEALIILTILSSGMAVIVSIHVVGDVLQAWDRLIENLRIRREEARGGPAHVERDRNRRCGSRGAQESRE